jgi:cellulose synthase/poly-beta-1,6-N-acetylglucosamine synthase-like glycosyltransferase
LPEISTVITVRNAVATIGECLDTILKQEYPSESIEVIVVDAGSTDGTRENVLQYEKVVLVDDLGGTIGSGRNVGIRRSPAAVIAITDADMAVDNDWLRTACGEFASAEIGAVGGPVLTHPSCKGLAALIGELWEESPRFKVRTEAPHDQLYTGNIAYRREALEKSGLFNESLVAAEDPELNWRVQNAGYKLIFQPAMRVYHHHRSTLRGFLHQRYRNGIGCGQLLHVNRRLRKTRRRIITAAALPLAIIITGLFLLTNTFLTTPLFYMGLAGLVGVCFFRGIEVYRRTHRPSFLFGAAFLTAFAWGAWSLGFILGLFRKTIAQAPGL